MNDDTERRLKAWGSASTPKPDPAFSARLEADLRSQAYFGSGSQSPDPSPWKQVFRPAVLVFSSIVLLVGALVFLRDSTSAEVIMSTASGTDVTLPDDSVVRGTAGLALPDGSQISVTERGSAVVDGVVLGGGTRAQIIDGQLEVLLTRPTAVPLPQPPERATTSPTLDPTATPAPTPTAQPVSDPQPQRTPAATPTPPPPPEPERTAVPEPTATEVPDRERPTRTPAPTTRPVATPGELESVTVSLSIEALGDRRALLTWSVSSDRFVARWEVVVTSGDRSRVIAVLRDPSVRELQVERLENPTAAYAVRARASGGAVLGQSNGVRFPLAD